MVKKLVEFSHNSVSLQWAVIVAVVGGCVWIGRILNRIQDASIVTREQVHNIAVQMEKVEERQNVIFKHLLSPSMTYHTPSSTNTSQTTSHD